MSQFKKFSSSTLLVFLTLLVLYSCLDPLVFVVAVVSPTKTHTKSRSRGNAAGTQTLTSSESETWTDSKSKGQSASLSESDSWSKTPSINTKSFSYSLSDTRSQGDAETETFSYTMSNTPTRSPSPSTLRIPTGTKTRSPSKSSSLSRGNAAGTKSLSSSKTFSYSLSDTRSQGGDAGTFSFTLETPTSSRTSTRTHPPTRTKTKSKTKTRSRRTKSLSLSRGVGAGAATGTFSESESPNSKSPSNSHLPSKTVTKTRTRTPTKVPTRSRTRSQSKSSSLAAAATQSKSSSLSDTLHPTSATPSDSANTRSKSPSKSPTPTETKTITATPKLTRSVSSSESGVPTKSGTAATPSHSVTLNESSTASLVVSSSVTSSHTATEHDVSNTQPATITESVSESSRSSSLEPTLSESILRYEAPAIPADISHALTDTAFGVATASGAANVVVIQQLQRNMALLKIARCGKDGSASLPLASSPTQVRIGTDWLAYHRGAVIFNTIICIGVLALYALAVPILMKAMSMTYEQAVLKARFPSYIFVPLSLLAAPTATSGAVLFWYGLGAEDVLLIVFFGMILVFGPIVTLVAIYYQHKSHDLTLYRVRTVPRDPTQTDSFKVKGMRFWYYLVRPTKQWADKHPHVVRYFPIYYPHRVIWFPPFDWSVTIIVSLMGGLSASITAKQHTCIAAASISLVTLLVHMVILIKYRPTLSRLSSVVQYVLSTISIINTTLALAILTNQTNGDGLGALASTEAVVALIGGAVAALDGATELYEILTTPTEEKKQNEETAAGLKPDPTEGMLTIPELEEPIAQSGAKSGQRGRGASLAKFKYAAGIQVVAQRLDNPYMTGNLAKSSTTKEQGAVDIMKNIRGGGGAGEGGGAGQDDDLWNDLMNEQAEQEPAVPDESQAPATKPKLGGGKLALLKKATNLQVAATRIENPMMTGALAKPATSQKSGAFDMSQMLAAGGESGGNDPAFWDDVLGGPEDEELEEIDPDALALAMQEVEDGNNNNNNNNNEGEGEDPDFWNDLDVPPEEEKEGDAEGGIDFSEIENELGGKNSLMDEVQEAEQQKPTYDLDESPAGAGGEGEEEAAGQYQLDDEDDDEANALTAKVRVGGEAGRESEEVLKRRADMANLFAGSHGSASASSSSSRAAWKQNRNNNQNMDYDAFDI